MKTLWKNGRLVTLNEKSGWGLIEDGAIISENGFISWVGVSSEAVAAADLTLTVDLQGALVTPGFIDAHTHLVYAGHRANEFEMRLEGATYEQIAEAGGGIVSTVKATRLASDAALLEATLGRAKTLLRNGVTTVEIKSGYGLSKHDEARCLRVARRVAEEMPLWVQTTCLAAHAVPPEFAGRTDEYIAAVCKWLPQFHANGLIDAVDVFCENIAFSLKQTRRVFEVARSLGIPVKLHAEQLSDQGGAALAAEFNALSCDHLEHLSAEGIAAMAKAGTIAVLLPGAYYFLRETNMPPLAGLREAGVPIALATDHNPGSSPTLSPLLIMNMACVVFRMTPEESLRGFTVNAASALGLKDRGRIAVQQRADFVIWPSTIVHPNQLSYEFGQAPKLDVVIAGKKVRDDI